MIARLLASLCGVAAGVAVLAHVEPGASWAAVAGWALLLAAFVNLVTLRHDEHICLAEHCQVCGCHGPLIDGLCDTCGGQP